MKRIMIVTGLVVLLGIVFLPLEAFASDMGYSDPTGDVDNEGMSGDVLSNVDIIEIKYDATSDPVVLEMKVQGTIDLDPEGNLFYHYYFYLDHDGDNAADTEIEIDTMTENTFSSDYDTEIYRTLTTEVSGNGTSTIRIEFPASWISSGPAVVDIYGSTEVGDLWNWADDDVNEDFEGGTPIGGGGVGDDDDDTTPADDDDDTTPADDDDDNGDDSPGFEMALILPLLALIIGVLYFKKRRTG